MLEYHEIMYTSQGYTTRKFDMQNKTTVLRKTSGYEWLNEVSLNSLTIVCNDLYMAFNRYFKHQNRIPKFKSRKYGKNNFPLRYDRTKIKDEYVKIPNVGLVKYKGGFQKSYKKLINPRVSFNKNGKWILSFQLEIEKQDVELSDKIIGIDLGIKELATCSINYELLVFHNINNSKRVKMLVSKLKHIQRRINKKYTVNGDYTKTNEVLKYERIMKKIYHHLNCIRKNHIHQCVSKIISYYPKTIVMEKLNVIGMMKNKCLATKVKEAYFYMFKEIIKYKCAWYGIEFIQTDRFYPSSKLCSCCGNIKRDLKLSDRVYRCSYCGNIVDRDYNAAINLMQYGIEHQLQGV